MSLRMRHSAFGRCWWSSLLILSRLNELKLFMDVLDARSRVCRANQCVSGLGCSNPRNDAILLVVFDDDSIPKNAKKSERLA